ncbi:MAG: hypothetical protein HHJ09_08350 [Glaciimonas sp.]|nr:hypothetical protein [Glaciimonas sp.]
MIQILVLQQLYNLAGDALQDQLLDHRSLLSFPGLAGSSTSPSWAAYCRQCLQFLNHPVFWASGTPFFAREFFNNFQLEKISSLTCGTDTSVSEIVRIMPQFMPTSASESRQKKRSMAAYAIVIE